MKSIRSNTPSFKNTFFFFSVLCIMILLSCSSDACDNCEEEMEMQVNEERLNDSLILVSLYNSTDGPNWEENWDLNTSMDNWFGITLNTNGTVQQIELQGNGHNGTLPDNLANFSEIVALEVRSGILSGEIPSGLDKLTSLRFLRFDDNGLEGSIPDDLVNISTLEILDLAENNLIGNIPTGFGDITSMNFIDFSENNLTGSIPDDFSDLSSIVFLTIRNNDLSGCFPDQFLNLCNENGISIFPNPKLPWLGNFDMYCNGFPQIGALCELDGVEGTIDENCNCIN